MALQEVSFIWNIFLIETSIELIYRASLAVIGEKAKVERQKSVGPEEEVGIPGNTFIPTRTE